MPRARLASPPSTLLARIALIAAAILVVVAVCDLLAGRVPAYADVVAGETAFAAAGVAQEAKTPIESAVVQVKDQVYKGKALTPTVKVMLSGQALKRDRDFTVTYSANNRVGVAMVAVRGVGAYTGAVPATFTIFAPKAGWQTIGGAKYYLANKNGKTAKGWKDIAGNRYYFDKTTGVMLRGLVTIGSARYYLHKKTGAARVGWQKIGTPKKLYYFDPVSYAALTGQVTAGGLKLWFSSTGVLKKKWYDEARRKVSGKMVVTRPAGWYPVGSDHSNGHRFHQRQGNGVNCGATSFIVGVNIMLGTNRFTDNVAVWSSKQFKKDSVDHLGDKGQAWLKANGLDDQIRVHYVSGDIHDTAKLRKFLEKGQIVIMCSGSESHWRLNDGTTMNDHPTGHWIVFYCYKNGIYYANDSRHEASKGAGCVYTERQMQQWLDGRDRHAAIAMEHVIFG